MLNLRLIQSVGIIYLIYSFYLIALYDVTTLKLIDLLPAFFLMWINFFLFVCGDGHIRKENKSELKIVDDIISNLSGGKLIVLGIAVLLMSAVSANFYTGQTPISIIRSLLSGTSNFYYDYQTHAFDNQLGVFTAIKIPFILINFVVKFLFFFSFIVFFLKDGRLKMAEKVYLFLITCSHLYFGIARGTSFELFELLVISIYIVLNQQDRKKLQHLIFIIILCIICSAFYSSNLLGRGLTPDFYYYSTEWEINKTGVLYYFFPSIVGVITLFYGYFGFGFVYTSHFITDLFLSSVGNFLLGLFPLGYEVIQGAPIVELMDNYLMKYVRFMPLCVTIINNIGVIGLFCFDAFCGVVHAKSKNIENYNYKKLIDFLIFYEMLSLPLNNFVFISSASTLIVVFVSGYYVWKHVFKLKIKI